MYVTVDDINFCDGPETIGKVKKLCINSTWIALFIHGFVPVETYKGGQGIPLFLRQDKPNFERKIVKTFLSVSLNICFGCSKEPSHLDGSFEYTVHMFG